MTFFVKRFSNRELSNVSTAESCLIYDYYNTC